MSCGARSTSLVLWPSFSSSAGRYSHFSLRVRSLFSFPCPTLPQGSHKRHPISTETRILFQVTEDLAPHHTCSEHLPLLRYRNSRARSIPSPLGSVWSHKVPAVRADGVPTHPRARQAPFPVSWPRPASATRFAHTLTCRIIHSVIFIDQDMYMNIQKWGVPHTVVTPRSELR